MSIADKVTKQEILEAIRQGVKEAFDIEFVDLIQMPIRQGIGDAFDLSEEGLKLCIVKGVKEAILDLAEHFDWDSVYEAIKEGTRIALSKGDENE